MSITLRFLYAPCDTAAVPRNTRLDVAHVDGAEEERGVRVKDGEHSRHLQAQWRRHGEDTSRQLWQLEAERGLCVAWLLFEVHCARPLVHGCLSPTLLARLCTTWLVLFTMKLSCPRCLLLRAADLRLILRSTSKDSYKDPGRKQPLTKYHPNALRNRMPVHFANEAAPQRRFCQPRNQHTHECAHPIWRSQRPKNSRYIPNPHDH